MWEDLLERSDAAGVGIRNIWIADVTQENQSSVLNEGKLGNDREYQTEPRCHCAHVGGSVMVRSPSRPSPHDQCFP